MRHNEIIFHYPNAGISIIEDGDAIYGLVEEPPGMARFMVSDADFWRKQK
jgi:hypothetical protein